MGKGAYLVEPVLILAPSSPATILVAMTSTSVASTRPKVIVHFQLTMVLIAATLSFLIRG